MSITDRILRTEHELALLEEEIAFWQANVRAKGVMGAVADRRPAPVSGSVPPERALSTGRSGRSV